MESTCSEDNKILATLMDLLRGENEETLESLVRILRELKQVHGNLQNGFAQMHLIVQLNKEGTATKAENAQEVSPPRFQMFDFNRTDHPMRNPVILKNIFRFCCVETLKFCCLVSKEWNALSSETLRSKAIIGVTQKEKEDRLKELLEKGKSFDCFFVFPYYKWEEQTRLMDIVPNMTYLHMELASNRRLQLQLIFSHFHQLRYLNLGVNFNCRREFEGLEIKSPLLKLRTLKLCVTSYILENLEPLPEQFSAKVLEKVPNLEALHVKFNLCLGQHELNAPDRIAIQNNSLRNIFTAAINVRMNNSFSIFHLKELNISQPKNEFVTALPEDLAEIIKQCQFPLKSLTVDIGKETTSSAIGSLLEAHANTLQYFRTILMVEESGGDCKGKVKLPKLERMEIVSEAPTAFHFMGSLETNNLDTLIISQDKAEKLPKYYIGCCFREEMKNTDVCSNDSIPPPVLDSVHLPNLQRFQYWGRVYFSENELNALARAMPNLRHLQMNICADTFPVVCKLWPRLWTLLLTSPDKSVPAINDYALTGLELGQSNSIERRPNITDLKELTDFTYLHYFGRVPSWQLTCHSVTHGFIQLPRLNFLDVGFRKLSFDARKALENHVPNLHVFCEEYFIGDWKMTTPGYFDWCVSVRKQQHTTEGNISGTVTYAC